MSASVDGNQEADTGTAEGKSKSLIVEDGREVEEFTLDPRESKSEKSRDALLKLLDSTFFRYLGILVLILVIIDGAFFFFLLVGWQAMCNDPTRTDCDPRDWWYNWSIQVLNVLFTYMAVVSMPWRCINAIHLSGGACPRRSFEIGHDLYGRPTELIWFHIPRLHKALITAQLLGNCIAQFINQGTRIYYPDFDSQNKAPGSIWTNVFFGLSFFLAFTGVCCILHQEGKLRKEFPGRFGPGPVDTVKVLIDEYKKRNTTAEGVANKDENSSTDIPKEGGDISHHSSTRKSVTPCSREAMRCFAM